MLKGVGQYTEGWGSTQRGGTVHRRVGQYKEGWGSTQRGVAVQRRVGAVHIVPQHHSDPSSIMTQLLSLIQCQVRSDNKINRLEV